MAHFTQHFLSDGLRAIGENSSSCPSTFSRRMDLDKEKSVTRPASNRDSASCRIPTAQATSVRVFFGSLNA